MSPLKLHILLAYYCSPTGEVIVEASPEEGNAIGELIVEGFMFRRSDESHPSLTEMGHAYVEALKALPVPTKEVTWVIPEFRVD